MDFEAAFFDSSNAYCDATKCLKNFETWGMQGTIQNASIFPSASNKAFVKALLSSFITHICCSERKKKLRVKGLKEKNLRKESLREKNPNERY